MKRSSFKLIIICSLLVLFCALGAIMIKTYFFPDIDKNEVFVPTQKEKYEYNEFNIINVSDENLSKRYFFDYIDLILNDTMEAYKLLASELKSKYPNYEDFKKFVDANIDVFKTGMPKSYKVLNFEGKKTYIVVDQFNNKYTFDTNAVLVYTIMLDFNE